MQKWLIKTKTQMEDKEFIISLVLSLVLFSLSLVVNYYAGLYADRRASNAVTDVILSNTRVYDVDAFFNYGPLFFWSFVGILCFWEPKRLPFTLKSIALFTLVRSVFISLTHIGPFPTEVLMDSTSFTSKFSFGADLFFSGHTGLPFLMSLIFWQDKYLRYIFLASAIFFGAVVLLGHIHYSIDVLSAFFITYTIFHIALFFFKKDRQTFFNGIR